MAETMGVVLATRPRNIRTTNEKIASTKYDSVTCTNRSAYHIMMHLLVGGSALLDGECFSISCKQSWKTLPV
jgi:hypothetical protein